MPADNHLSRRGARQDSSVTPAGQPQPDGRGHAAVKQALLRSCPYHVPPGHWSCPEHRAELEARAEEIRQATRPLDRST